MKRLDCNRSKALPPAFRAVAMIAFFFGVMLVWSFVGYLAADGVAPGFADKDFANYWAAAHLAADGRTGLIFGPNAPYLAHLRGVMGADFPWHNWSYPPHYLLLMMPLALVGYKAGVLLFLGTTGLFFARAVRAFVGPGHGVIAAVAVAPLVVLNGWTVQNGFLTGGLMLWALALRERRPVLAGLCLGAMSIKPQLALLLPLLMLMERRWMVLAVAAATTILLVGASLAVFGQAAWDGYLGTIVPYQVLVMTELGGTFLTMLPSVFGGARLMGMGAADALLLHMPVAVAAGCVTLAALLVVPDARRRAGIVLVATFIVTPYALNYDLGGLGAALAAFVVIEHDAGSASSRWQRLLLAVAMLLPILMMLVGRFYLPLAPLTLIAVVALMLGRAGFAHAITARFRPRHAPF